MRRNDLAQLRAGGAVPLPGAFYGTAEHVAGDDGQDDGVPDCVPAQIGNELQEEGWALASQSSLPGGLTASGHPCGTYPYPSRSTMGQ